MSSVPRGLIAYAATLSMAAAAMVAGLVGAGFPLSSHGSAWPLIGFALLAISAERESVRLSESIEISIAFLPLLFAAVVFGPLAAALIGGMTVATDFKPPYLRWTVWASSRTLLGGIVGVAAFGAFQVELSRPAQIILATGVAAFVEFSLDLLLSSTTLIIRGT